MPIVIAILIIIFVLPYACSDKKYCKTNCEVLKEYHEKGEFRGYSVSNKEACDRWANDIRVLKAVSEELKKQGY